MFLPLRISVTFFLSLILLSVTSLKEIKGDQPLTITINEGSVRALSLAMVPKDDDKLIKIFDIVAKDLKLTGRIDIFNQEDISSQPTGFKEVNFKNWRIFGVENISAGNSALKTSRRIFFPCPQAIFCCPFTASEASRTR